MCEGKFEGSKSQLEGSKGQSKGSESQLERCEGQQEGSEGQPGGMDIYKTICGWMFKRIDRISPPSTGLCPPLGPLPKKCKNQIKYDALGQLAFSFSIASYLFIFLCLLLLYYTFLCFSPPFWAAATTKSSRMGRNSVRLYLHPTG